MTSRRRPALSLRAKVLLLALSLALPPLVLASVQALNAFDRARVATVETSAAAMSAEAVESLARRASDKAQYYDSELAQTRRQMESVARYAESQIAASAPPTGLSGRVWVSPDGPSVAAERANALSVARARQFIPLLRAVVAQNALVSLGYFALDDGGVVAFDKDIIDILVAIKPFEVRERSWYRAARAARATVWVDTYVDANTKKLTTTVATPIYDARRTLLGVVGFDVLLDTIRADVLQIEADGPGEAFLMNENGTVLVRTDRSEQAGLRWNEPFQAENLMQSDDPNLAAVATRMMQSERGVARLTFDGGDVYLAFAPIESAGWSVGIVTPVSAIVAPADRAGAVIEQRQEELRTQLITLLVLALTIVPLLAGLLALLLTRPLRALQSGAERIAAGNLSHRIPVRDAPGDELFELSRSFNVMADSLQQQVGELETNINSLSMLNSASNRFRGMLSIDDLLRDVPRSARSAFGFERVVLYLVEGHALRAVSAAFGRDNAEDERRFLDAVNEIAIDLAGDTIEAEIIRSGQAVVVTDPWNDPRVLRAKQAVSRSDAYVQVPIFGREERIIGLLSADFFYTQRAPTGRDATQLMTYASMVGLTIENTRLYGELERQVAQRTTDLRAALVRAQDADRLKGQFLAAISHELRTPLNAIIGFSTVMLDELDGPITALQGEDLKTINRNGRFLLHLINDLLDLARIDAGKLDLDRRPTDIHELVGDVAETVQGLLHNRATRLRILLPATLPRAHIDAAKTRQILLNLLANAVKFTERGTITITAQSVVAANDQAEPGAHDQLAFETLIRNGRRIRPFIAISVRDTGVGIAAEHLPSIFEEFQQVDPHNRERRGSGLGLAICRRLVNAHGGKIWVESTLGQGSVFTFTLPCYFGPLAADLPQNGQHTAPVLEEKMVQL